MSATSETATPRKIGGSLWLTQAFASSIRPGKSVAASYGNANRDFTVPEDVVLVFYRYVHKQRYSKATGQSVTRRELSEEQDEVFVPAGTSVTFFCDPSAAKSGESIATIFMVNMQVTMKSGLNIARRTF